MILTFHNVSYIWTIFSFKATFLRELVTGFEVDVGGVEGVGGGGFSPEGEVGPLLDISYCCHKSLKDV